jgi:DNA-binding transcriptional MerR regulator
VLRFWESRFNQIKPMKRAGGRRYYRPEDLELLRGIRHLLYGQGYTIRGVQRILKEQGAKFVQEAWQNTAWQNKTGQDSPDQDSSDEDDAQIEVDEDAVEDASMQPAAEQGGLREKLKSLVGRDLGDPMDDARARPDPPLQAAPFPRIAPGDRPTGLPSHDQQTAPLVAPASGPASRGAKRDSGRHRDMEQVQPGLAPDHHASLQAALEELEACRTVLDAALMQDA